MCDDATFFETINATYARTRTREDYTERLKRLQSICNGASLYTIISQPENYYKLIKLHYPKPTSRKGMVTALLSLFKCKPELKESLAQPYQRWIGYHRDMKELVNFQYESNEATPAQEARYTSYDEIRLKYISLTKGGDPHATRGSSQQVVWLSILLAYPPKRADYASFRIYTMGKDPNKTGENYLVYRTDPKVGPSLAVFTKYKTDRTYGKVVEVVPPRLQRDISVSLARHPRKYLFVNRNGEPFASNNLFSQYITYMSVELFGRPTGVSDFRHAFINTLDMRQSKAYLNAIAARMMHSFSTQKDYSYVPDETHGPSNRK